MKKVKQSGKNPELEKKLKHYLGALSEHQTEQLKAIKEGFFVVNSKLDEHSKKLDSHTEMIGLLLEDMEIVKGELKKKVDYDEFLALVRRVQKIESKI